MYVYQHCLGTNHDDNADDDADADDDDADADDDDIDDGDEDDDDDDDDDDEDDDDDDDDDNSVGLSTITNRWYILKFELSNSSFSFNDSIPLLLLPHLSH